MIFFLALWWRFRDNPWIVLNLFLCDNFQETIGCEEKKKNLGGNLHDEALRMSPF